MINYLVTFISPNEMDSIHIAVLKNIPKVKFWSQEFTAYY